LGHRKGDETEEKRGRGYGYYLSGIPPHYGNKIIIFANNCEIVFSINPFITKSVPLNIFLYEAKLGYSSPTLITNIWF